MATNLSNIGFDIKEDGDMEALARKCFQNGRATRCEQGSYIRWEIGGGVELWAQLNAREELIGLNPHFQGKTRMSAGLIGRVTRAGFPMDGGLRSLAEPFGNDPIRGAFAFVFDTPDFLLNAELTLPMIHSIHLTAFAQQCNVFENDEDYKTRAARHGISLPAESFVALGLTDKNRQPLPEPLATAMVNGHIQDLSLATNPFSKRQYWWLRIRTMGGELDVVADPELLPRGAKPGGILQCTAWLSGRVQ